MMNIGSLLNPEHQGDLSCVHPLPDDQISPTLGVSVRRPVSLASTSRPDTPMETSPTGPRRLKPTKNATVLQPTSPQRTVNYPPFEPSGTVERFNESQRVEVARNHQRFKVIPSEQWPDDLIGDHPRHIPYSSDKKDFLEKTGRDAVDVFQYEFEVPNHPKPKHIVMWDYINGLVRVTPFFKACRHGKTIPAKAIAKNEPLKDLCHSLTGGAIDAQGYWMPYDCARALCLTFCYEIRWCLTPIFGSSFVNECLQPHEPGFKSFKIDRQIVHNAAVEAQRWKTGCRPTSIMTSSITQQTMPRREPSSSTPAQSGLQDTVPNFKTGSPFDTQASVDHRTRTSSLEESLPPLSPKSHHKSTPTSPSAVVSSPWNSINRGQQPHRLTPPMLYAQQGILQSNDLRYPPTAPWRETNGHNSTLIVATPTSTTNASQNYRATNTTASSSSGSEYMGEASSSSSSSSVSGGTSLPAAKKRKQYANLGIRIPPAPPGKPSKHGEVKWEFGDREAALALLALKHDVRGIGVGNGGSHSPANCRRSSRGKKRKAGAE